MEVYNKLNKNSDEFNFIDAEKYSNTFVLKDTNYTNNINNNDNLNIKDNNLIKYITDTFTIVKCYNNNYVIINKQNKQKSKNVIILDRTKLFRSSSKYKINISDNLILDHNNSPLFQRYNTEITQSITNYNKLNVLKIFITKYGNITSLTNKEVTEFIFLLLKKVFRNIIKYKGFSTVKEKIQKYVEYHSNTHITLYELTNKIKHKDIKILSNINKESNMESTKVLDKLMLFIFDTLVVDIINRTMYVTQHSGNDSRYYYYGREYYHRIDEESIKKSESVEENILKEESESEKENIKEEKTIEKDTNSKNSQLKKLKPKRIHCS